MSCQWAMLLTESSYKTPVTATTAGVDHLVLELLDDDPIGGMEVVPANEQLYSWLACGEPDRAIGETSAIEGTIRTLLYPEQANLLLGWAYRPVADQGVTGFEIPWVTSEPAGQFASMAMDYSYRDDAGTERKARLLGGKVTGATLTAARGTRDGAFVLELQVTFSERTTTTTTAPLAATYPTGAPYFLSATSGNVAINSTVISDYDSLTIAGAYTTNARYDEATVVSRIRHHRQEYTLQLASLLKFTPDWRALMLDRTTFPAAVTLDYPGGTGEQSITFDFGANSRVTDGGWTRALPIAADRTQQLTILSQYDRTAETLMEIEVGVQS